IHSLLTAISASSFHQPATHRHTAQRAGRREPATVLRRPHLRAMRMRLLVELPMRTGIAALRCPQIVGARSLIILLLSLLLRIARSREVMIQQARCKTSCPCHGERRHADEVVATPVMRGLLFRVGCFLWLKDRRPGFGVLRLAC